MRSPLGAALEVCGVGLGLAIMVLVTVTSLLDASATTTLTAEYSFPPATSIFNYSIPPESSS